MMASDLETCCEEIRSYVRFAFSAQMERHTAGQIPKHLLKRELADDRYRNR